MIPHFCNAIADKRRKVYERCSSGAKQIWSNSCWWRRDEDVDCGDDSDEPHCDPGDIAKSRQQQVRAEEQTELIFENLPNSWSIVLLVYAGYAGEQQESCRSLAAHAFRCTWFPVPRSIEESLIAEDDYYEHRKSIEAREDAKVVAPLKLLVQQAGEQRS